MKIYVLCDTYVDYGQYDRDTEIEQFKDVASIEKVVVIWAQQEVKANKIRPATCKVYDDVGLCVGRVDLKKTAAAGRVVMAQ